MRHFAPTQTSIATRTRRVLTAAACIAAMAVTAATRGEEPPTAPAQDAPPKVLESTTTSVQPIDLPDSSKPKAAPTPAPTATADTSLTITPDRPGFGDTTTIAPVGHLQLETGYTYTFRDRDGVESQTHNGPELLARVGLIADRLELRISAYGYIYSRTNDGSGAGFADSEGFSDVSIGARVKLTDQSGMLPRLALGVSTTIGVGDSDVSNRHVEPTLRLIGSWDLGSNFSLTTNAGFTYARPSDGRFVQVFGSASLGYAATDRLSLFVEYFVVGPRSKGTHAAHAMDFGGAFLLDKRVQIDARMGVGLNQEADNMFAGAGLSVLF